MLLCLYLSPWLYILVLQLFSNKKFKNIFIFYLELFLDCVRLANFKYIHIDYKALQNSSPKNVFCFLVVGLKEDTWWFWSFPREVSRNFFSLIHKPNTLNDQKFSFYKFYWKCSFKMHLYKHRQYWDICWITIKGLVMINVYQIIRCLKNLQLTFQKACQSC